VSTGAPGYSRGLGWNDAIPADRRTNGAKTKREVILYYGHFCSPAVQREVARLGNELDSRYDIFTVGYCRYAALKGIDCVPALEYSADDLMALPYPDKVRRFDPDSYFGNADLAPMKFFLDRPDYDYYWIVEYDGRFSGAWSDLFADLSSSAADLLCTTMQTWTENPNWAHWGTLDAGSEEVSLERRVKGFMPFSRLSHALLAACDERYRSGRSGHCEVIWPTIARLGFAP
jgi:hypothetical protein